MDVRGELIEEETAFDFSLAPVSADITEAVLVELVDACNGACVTCARGMRYMKNRRGQMNLDAFEKILDKLAAMSFHWVSLFNWSDPFLCRGLAKYTELVSQKGLSCQLSSNLSYRSIPDLIPILRNTEELIVSVSGFHQPTYRINHRSGNVELVKANLRKIAEAKQAGLINTKVCIYYFNFPYSHGEWPLFKRFTMDLGLQPVLWHGEGDPLNPEMVRKNLAEEMFHVGAPDTLWSGFSGMPLALEPPDYAVCYSASYPTIIDSYGDVHLCPRVANTPATRVGNFLEDDFDVLQYRRVTHPICARCKMKSPIQISPVHMGCLVRGALKQYGYRAHDLTSMEQDAVKAEELKGKEVFFWGCGEMYRRKCHIFRESKPRCIISEVPSPEKVNDLHVFPPGAVLPHSDTVPIVIFAGRAAGNKIMETIKTSWPRYTDIYLSTEDAAMWPAALRTNGNTAP